MRIAILVGRFGAGTGTGGVASRLARALRERHDVHVWTSVVDHPLDGVPTHDLGDRRTAADRARGFVRLALDRVPGCEVVRASGGVHAVWARIRGRRWGDGAEARLDRDAVRSARRVICNSCLAAAEVVTEHGVDPARIRVVRNGADAASTGRREQVRREWNVPDGGRVALFLGHGFRRKGLDVAARAFAEVATERDRLVVAGHDPHAERYLRPHRDGRLVVVGAVPAHDALPGADALLHPTLYDPAANVVLEAMAHGVPPVTSARDGAAELVPDRSLVVADALDVQGFARALRYAWGDAPDRARLRTEALRWPVPRMTEAIERILEECADGG